MAWILIHKPHPFYWWWNKIHRPHPRYRRTRTNYVARTPFIQPSVHFQKVYKETKTDAQHVPVLNTLLSLTKLVHTSETSRDTKRLIHRGECVWQELLCSIIHNIVVDSTCCMHFVFMNNIYYNNIYLAKTSVIVSKCPIGSHARM